MAAGIAPWTPVLSFRDSGMRVSALTAFGIAMGFLEAAVVVYLRWLYYPEGFSFPLKPVVFERLYVEYLREIATLIMLFSFSLLAGRNFQERLSFFLFSFGVWDISYYGWLKLLLDWPSSMLTWDILFLIPVIWTGPVLAPVICSLTMIAIGGCIMYFQHKGYAVKIGVTEAVFFLSGAVIIFATFVWDFSAMILTGNYIFRVLTLAADPEFRLLVSNYVPDTYGWRLFALGEFLMLISLLMLCRKARGTRK
ncbi:MAG: hypothetical protein AB1552_02130 [Nitrospirota bacterium]